MGDRWRPIGIWTQVHDRAWTAEAYRRIYERELLARLPGACLRFVGVPADGSPFVTERGDIVTSLAAAGDNGASGSGPLVAAAPDETDLTNLSCALDGLRTQPPVILSAISCLGSPHDGIVARAINGATEVSVRDATSLGVVQALGSHHGVSLVPDPLLLASRLIGRDEAVARVEYLRAMDGYPDGETVLVEVSAARPDDLSALGRAVAGAIVRGYRFSVIAIPSRGETMTAELRLAAERELAPVHCVGRPAILEDLAAMVATANAVVPLSPALLAIACAFGRSSLWRPPASADRAPLETTLPPGLIHESFDCLLQSVPEPSAADGWRMRVDAHFDAIAARLSALDLGASRPPAAAADRMTQLETAHRIAGRRLADERLRFAERTEGLQAERARLKTELARRSALEAVLRQEAADAQAHARHEAARSEIFVRRIDRLESTVGRLQAEHAALADERATLVRALDDARRDAAGKADLIAAQRREIDELRGAVDRFARSRSWRYLAPARAVGRIIRRALGIPT